jgi:general L-amino acid transport system permease protein
VPELKGFNVAGGMSLSLQFTALVVALGVYHGGQIGAIVRGGIIATSSGQREAAQALGLDWFKTMRLIVLPQALRVITPPLGNQYSNLLKNTSIALAVGYSDLLSVVSTSVNQTFRPIELMLLVAGFFLVVNMLISALVNWFSHTYRLKGR